jgi:hypothetical protein
MRRLEIKFVLESAVVALLHRCRRPRLMQKPFTALFVRITYVVVAGLSWWRDGERRQGDVFELHGNGDVRHGALAHMPSQQKFSALTRSGGCLQA